MWGGYPQQTWPYMTPSIWVLNTAIPLEQFSFTLSLEYYIPTFNLWFRKKYLVTRQAQSFTVYSIILILTIPHSPQKKVPFKRVSLIFGQVVWGLFEPVTITSQIQKSKVLPVTSRRWTDVRWKFPAIAVISCDGSHQPVALFVGKKEGYNVRPPFDI